MSTTTTTPRQADEEAPALPPQPLASDLCWLLARASQLLLSESNAALAQSGGISARQHAVLATALCGEHTQSDLARKIGMDKTTMMVTVDELERAGFAERRPLPGDRRARMIAVTPAGKKAVRAADAVLDRVRDRVLELLPDGQRETFLQSLGYLACAESVSKACACCGERAFSA